MLHHPHVGQHPHDQTNHAIHCLLWWPAWGHPSMKCPSEVHYWEDVGLWIWPKYRERKAHALRPYLLSRVDWLKLSGNDHSVATVDSYERWPVKIASGIEGDNTVTLADLQCNSRSWCHISLIRLCHMKSSPGSVFFCSSSVSLVLWFLWFSGFSGSCGFRGSLVLVVLWCLWLSSSSDSCGSRGSLVLLFL